MLARSTFLVSPLAMFAACYVTILAYGIPTGEAASLAFLRINRYAYVLGAALGVALVIGARYLPKRTSLIAGGAAVLILGSVAVGAFLGFATLY
jgi:hypothetical protein